MLYAVTMYLLSPVVSPCLLTIIHVSIATTLLLLPTTSAPLFTKNATTSGANNNKKAP